MRRLRALLLATIFVPSLSDVSAQVLPAAGHADPTGVLKSELRNLVTAQEAYFAKHGTYTTDVSALGMFKPGSKPPTDSVWVQVIQAGGRSWWGRAVYRTQRSRSCVIYVGSTEDFTEPPSTDSGKVKAQREGEPVCDPP